MAYDDVVIPYKGEAASSDINQLDENVRVHDHRPDGTQGAPMRGNWVDCTSALVAAAGWAKTGAQRYRLLLGGALVQYDFLITRTGADIVANAVGTTNPGNAPDTPVLTGIPDVAEALGGQYLTLGQFSPFHFAVGGDGITLTAGVTSGVVSNGQAIDLVGTLIGNA